MEIRFTEIYLRIIMKFQNGSEIEPAISHSYPSAGQLRKVVHKKLM